MVEQVSVPDFSQVKDPLARAMLEQMSGMIGALQRTVEQQTAIIDGLRQELAEMKRQLFGQKRERLPSVDRQLRRRNGSARKPNDAEARQEAQEDGCR
jgi:hypothetical protein